MANPFVEEIAQQLADATDLASDAVTALLETEARKFKRYFSVSPRGAAPRELTAGTRVAAAYAPAEGRRPNALRPRQGPFFKRLLFGTGTQKAQGEEDRAGGGFAHRRERRQEGWEKA